MGRSIATKWIIGLLMYFVVLFFFLSMINNLTSEYSLYDDDTITSTGGSYGLNNVGVCESPRENDLSKYDSKCSSLVDIGKIYDNVSCTGYEGCVWEETGKFLWIFGDSTYGCYENINTTHYNAGVNYTSYNPFGYVTDSVCEMSNLSNEGMCSAFGCTWYPDNTFEELKYKEATSGVFNVIKNIITLRVTFATTNSGVNAILTFMLIWIPLIILILSGYIMIR